jgi:hypothetical protein
MTTVVIMPGGFHPYHAGHHALYQSAQRAFPDADVYVAATNDTSTRPFPFAVKEKLAKLAGVEPGHFVQVKSPFRAEEITSKYNPATDQLIFVRSEKDQNSPPKPGGVKKDGNPSYLQPYSANQELAPFNQHAYMAYLPTVEFGPGMTSATQIRTAWPTLNEKRKTALVMSLYPRTQTNPQLAASVVKLLDAAIGTEPVAEGWFFKSPEEKVAAKHKRDLKLVKDGIKWLDRMIYTLEEDNKIDIDSWDFLIEPDSLPNHVASSIEQSGLIKQISREIKHWPKNAWGAQSNTDLERSERLLALLKSLRKIILDSAMVSMSENQGWAATFTNEQTGQMAGTPAVGGMTATYQRRENQPIAEDYLEEKRSR